MEILISFGLIGFFLILTAVFAGAETGFVCLDVERLRVLARKPEAGPENELLKIALAPERFLALTLIGINMSIVVATSLSTNLLEKHGAWCTACGTAILSFVIFLFCEVVPKIAFTSNPLSYSLKVLPIIRMANRLFLVPISLLSRLTRKVMEWAGIRTDRGRRKISREELLILLHKGATAGIISDKPHRMARGIINLKDTKVSEVMVPRTGIEALDIAWPMPRIKKVLAESGYSRLPVFEGSIDHIVGMVYFKDVLLHGFDQQEVRKVMGPVMFVPEVKSAYRLFRDMLTRQFQAAVVLDEFGAPSGFVTLEDLIEEVVGEIHDELDEPVAGIKVHADGSMTVRGAIDLNALEEQAGITFQGFEDAATLNGAIMAALGRIPVSGECLQVFGWSMTVIQADQRKVILVRIHPQEGHSA
jgi:CBS domain containing-hemolysin-like protein